MFFNFFGAANLTTQLGADFSIRSLTFTEDDVSAVTIGGANTLTIGTGGITDNATNAGALPTMSTNVALGASQSWTNNTTNVFTVIGGVSGGPGNALTIAGSGAFTFTNANSIAAPPVYCPMARR